MSLEMAQGNTKRRCCFLARERYAWDRDRRARLHGLAPTSSTEAGRQPADRLEHARFVVVSGRGSGAEPVVASAEVALQLFGNGIE